MKARFLLVLLLFIPTVSADWGATVEGSYLHYHLDTFSQDRDNPATGTIFSRTITTTPTHGYEIAASEGTIHIHALIKTASSATGIYAFQATWDGTNIPDCMWAIETTNQVLTQTNIFPHVVVSCELTEAQLSDGTHTFAITRSIQAGTPATIDHELVTYEIERTDLLEPSTMNDLIEFFNLVMPLLFFFLAVVWAEFSKEPLVYVLAVVLGGLAVAALWSEALTLRGGLVAAIVLVAMRGFFEFRDMDKERNEA